MSKPRFQPPAVCPICGDHVPPRALACPECGADEHSGWGSGQDHLGLEEDAFDYDSFIREEFGGANSRSPAKFSFAGLGTGFWWVAAIVILLALLAVRFFA